jgi:diguanylate cyclase
MSDKSSNKPLKSPTDIARETFKRLALERIAPTPEAYRKLYVEISGVPEEESVAVEVPQITSAELSPSEAETLLN